MFWWVVTPILTFTTPTPQMGDSTECSTRQAHGVGVPRGAGGRGAAFLISLAGPESAVPIGAGLGAQ